jgi:hypothetical protein
MALFLEQEWFACLNNFTTGRYMVVLDNERDDAANQRWQAGDLELTRYLAGSPVRLAELAPRLNLPVDVWRARFDAHLDRLRNRSVAYFLLTTFLGRIDAISWADLAPRNGPALQRWVDAELLDRQLQGFVRSWHQNPALAGLCESDGTGLGVGLEYQLQRKVVSRFVQATDGRSE